MAEDSDAVIALERRRAEAIGAGDFDALKDCLADHYLHVFGNGRTCGREAYVKTVTDTPRAPERGELTVRLYGDVAVLTGDLLNRIKPPDAPERVIDAFVTQVAARQADGRWRFVSFQITPKRALV